MAKINNPDDPVIVKLVKVCKPGLTMVKDHHSISITQSGKILQKWEAIQKSKNKSKKLIGFTWRIQKTVDVSTPEKLKAVLRSYHGKGFKKV